jgi:BASS family bile acid:Na+ symporter
MGLNDLILFSVIFLSMAVAIIFPASGEAFQPYILHCMMLLLFLSFLKIDFRALLDASLSATIRLTILVTVKLIILPTLLYAGALMMVPDYAVPILLLSGISTGVVAPFIATLLAAEVAQVLRMVIASSILVPFSLPGLVKLLAGAEVTIPLETMVRLLAIVIFVPMAAVVLMRRYFPGLPDKFFRRQFPISLLLFAVVNLGVFSKYSSFFFGHPREILISLGIAYVLSVIYYGAGFAVTPGRRLSERLAAGVSLAILNNVLVIVFASRFFGPLSPILAAMYMVPFFTMIVPVKLVARIHEARMAGGLDRS